MKEYVAPTQSNIILFFLGPVITLIFALLGFSVIPYSLPDHYFLLCLIIYLFYFYYFTYFSPDYFSICVLSLSNKALFSLYNCSLNTSYSSDNSLANNSSSSLKSSMSDSEFNEWFVVFTDGEGNF